MGKKRKKINYEKQEKLKIRLTIFLIIFATIFAVITAYQSTQIVLTNIELASLYAEEGIDEAINEISFENDTNVFIKGNEYNVKFNINNLDINSTYNIVFYINNKEINKIEYKNTDKIEDTINISEYFTLEGKNDLYIMILENNNTFKYQRTQTVYYVMPYQEQFLDELSQKGTNTHYVDLNWEKYEKDKELLFSSGVKVIRDSMKMSSVIKGNDVYDFSRYSWIKEVEDNEIKILLNLAGIGNTLGEDQKVNSEEEVEKVANFALKVAQGFPNIYGIEMFNEPNIKNSNYNGEGYTSEEYLNWYTRTVEEINKLFKENNIKVKLITGALSNAANNSDGILKGDTFFTKITEKGAYKNSYGYSYHPYDWIITEKQGERYHNILNQYKDTLNSFGGFIENDITEYGISSYDGNGVTEDVQSQKNVQNSVMMDKYNATLQLLYNFWNKASNSSSREANFGAIYNNYTPKLAYYAMKNYYQNTNGSEYIGTINLAEGLETHVYNKDGKPKIITWAKDNTKNITIEYKDFTATDLYGKEIQNQNGTLTITSSPVYLDNIQTSYYYQAISNTALEKYEEFEEKFKTELAKLPEIQKNINEQKTYMQSLENQTEVTQDIAIQEMQKHYNIGTELIKAVKENKLNIEYVKLSSMLDTLEDIGKSYEDLVTVTAIERNVDIQKAKKQIEETEKLIKNNAKLEIIYPEKIIQLSKEYNQKAEYINSLEEENPIKTGLIVSKNLHSTFLQIWAKDFAKIYIDKYLEEHKPTITYSTTEFINKDVIATINTDIDIQVTNNNGSKTYTFTQNGTFTFKYIINSTEYEITATVNNIDKTMPVISGVENGQTYYTDQKIAPKATDTNLKEVTLYLNNVKVNYKNGQTINVEGIYKLTATDKAGNATTMQFQVMERPESKYKVDGKIIKQIKYNTSKEEFDKNIGIIKDYKITRNNGKTELKQTDIIASGDILTTSSGIKYTLIVAGDITRDGQVTVDDFTRMRQYLLGLRKLDDIEKLSADANCDEKELSIDDYIRIRILILEQLSWK